MLSTPPVSLPIYPTSRAPRYELLNYTLHAGTAADQRQKVTGYLPKDDGLKNALTGADIVVIPAGIPREYPHVWHGMQANAVQASLA
jgi:malate dehydrogenase